MVIFNEAKPKYEKLDELLEEQLSNIRFSNKVNIIIDCKEVVRKFFRPDISPQYSSEKLLVEEISSDILNIIAHYRNYFYKRGKYSTFYFLYSFDKCQEMMKIFPDYKKEYYEKYFDNKDDPKVSIIKRAMKAVRKVVNYFPNCFFIETSKFDEFVYAKYIVSLIPENELSLILSNDEMLYQLISKNIFVLNIKGIKSELLGINNCMKVITKKDDTTITPALLPLVLSMAGNKRYSFKSLPNVAIIKAVNIVEKLVSEKKLIDTDSIKFPLELANLNQKSKMEKHIIDNSDTIIKNYSMIRADDILYKNKLIISNDFIFAEKVGKTNYGELNAKIYTSYPLMLDMMLKGEQI